MYIVMCKKNPTKLLKWKSVFYLLILEYLFLIGVFSKPWNFIISVAYIWVQNMGRAYLKYSQEIWVVFPCWNLSVCPVRIPLSFCASSSGDVQKQTREGPVLYVPHGTVLIIITSLTITGITIPHLHLNKDRRNLILHAVIIESLWRGQNVNLSLKMWVFITHLQF